jgi:hypothetical protein
MGVECGGWGAAQLSLNCSGLLSMPNCAIVLVSDITQAPPSRTRFDILTESAGSYSGAASWSQINVDFAYSWTFFWNGATHTESISAP